MVDVAHPTLSFIAGRSKPTLVQPQLQRMQAAAAKATDVVAIVATQEQVCAGCSLPD